MSLPVDGDRWRLFTPEEVAPMLGKSRATIYRLVKKKKLPHTNITGLGIRFLASDLDLIMKQAARGKR